MKSKTSFQAAESRKPKVILKEDEVQKQTKAFFFSYFAPCPIGVEALLYQELVGLSEKYNLGFERMQQESQGVSFHADARAMYWVNLYSRIASRLLILIKKGKYYYEDDIYHAAKKLPWDLYFTPKESIRLDISAHRSPVQSLNYVNLLVKDAVCDFFRHQTGARPDVDRENPAVRIFTHLSGEQFFFYIDTSGESLFKRGWRTEKGEAPIKENLAAAIIYLSGWLNVCEKGIPLMDGMCGSGTLAIEAAQMAKNHPAGLNRSFAFEKLKLYDINIWQEILSTAKANIKMLPQNLIFASDIDEKLVRIAKENAARAHVTEIDFSIQNIQELQPQQPQNINTNTNTAINTGIMVVNPPYGERIFVKQEGQLVLKQDLFFNQWASHLKKNYTGWSIFVLSADLNLPTQMRLKPQRKTVLFNGDLECRLFEFSMVQGAMKS